MLSTKKYMLQNLIPNLKLEKSTCELFKDLQNDPYILEERLIPNISS